MTEQEQHFARLAANQDVRLSVRGICIRNDSLLVQRTADDPTSCYAFVGGRVEKGDTFESRLRAEYEEELGGRLSYVGYRFVVENRFRVPEGFVHTVEHFFEVVLAPGEPGTREPQLVHCWLPLDGLPSVDLRPHVVRDALIDGTWRRVKHFIVPFEPCGFAAGGVRLHGD